MSPVDQPIEEDRAAAVTRGWVIPAIIGSALLMQTMNATVLSNALPTMAVALDEDPLRLNLALVDELQAKHASQIDQFKSLVQTFGGDALAASLDSQGLIAVAIITEKYFRCLGRAQELAFPESKPSSS